MKFRVFGSVLVALQLPDPISASKTAPHAKQGEHGLAQGLSEVEMASDALVNIHHPALDPSELQWPSLCETSASADQCCMPACGAIIAQHPPSPYVGAAPPG